MDIWKLENNVPEVAEYAAEALSAGGVILYPTDTLYGLGADAFSDAAVDKIHAIKGRDPSKPIHAVFANTDMIEDYAEVNDIGRILMDTFLPGPLTIVFRKRAGLETGIARMINTVGVRIPDNMFCVTTAHAFGRPFTTTSANLAGSVPGRSVSEILAQFGTSQHLVDLIVDVGELPKKEPSTVVDVSSGKLVVLREGAIKTADIKKVLA